MKKITFLAFFIIFVTNAQNPATIEVTINQPSSICNPADCATLTASYPAINSTTDYSVNSIPYTPFPYTGGTQISTAVGDAYVAVNLPFSFCFYGNNYNSLSIGNNGLVHFNPFTTNCPWQFTTQIPNPAFPAKNAIYGVYQDADASSTTSPTAQINYTTIGTSPNRKFIINFVNLGQYLCGLSAGLQTSQIVLYESSNIIDINVLRRVPCTTWNSGNGLIGIQNITGTQAVVPPGRNTGSWSANNESWRFTPNGVPVSTTFQWLENGIPISNNASVTVCPAFNSIYTVIVNYNICGAPKIINSSPVNIQVSNDLTQNPNNIINCTNILQIFIVDITSNNQIVLGSLNPSDYNILYHHSASDAQNVTNSIQNPTFYPTSQIIEIIYMSIEDLITGCVFVKPFAVESYYVSDPIANSSQSFTSGQTLNDLVITGANINWYANSLIGTTLPLNTLLVDGTTYYASQTLNCESQRIAITVHINLSNNTFNFEELNVFPNPTSNSVSISNKSTIDKIVVFTIIGQKIIEKVVNSNQATIDLSSYNSGVYFMEIYSNSGSKIVKIVKE